MGASSGWMCNLEVARVTTVPKDGTATLYAGFVRRSRARVASTAETN